MTAKVFALALAFLGCGDVSMNTPAPVAAVEPPARKPRAAVTRPVAQQPTPIKGQQLADRMKQPSTHVRFFNFWATWCQPCLAEMPVLIDFARRHPDAEVILVNVDQPQVQERRAVRYIEEQGLASVSHLLLDAKDPNVTLKTWVPSWPEQLPTTIVVDTDGRRVKLVPRQVDPMDLDDLLRMARKAR